MSDKVLSTQHRPTAKVLDILELLASSEEGFTLTQLASRTGAAKSSLFPVIHTMHERGFVTLDESSGRYKTGVHAYLTGIAYKGKSPAADYLRSCLSQIGNECKETCHLGILSGGDVLYIAKKETANPIRLRSRVGQKLPAYCTGIGKALISQMRKNDLISTYPEGLPRITPATITSYDELEAELARVRETGFAYEHEECTPGIQCVAVPIFNQGRILAALSVCIPIYRVNEPLMDKTRKILSRNRKQIEKHLSAMVLEPENLV